MLRLAIEQRRLAAYNLEFEPDARNQSLFTDGGGSGSDSLREQVPIGHPFALRDEPFATIAAIPTRVDDEIFGSRIMQAFGNPNHTIVFGVAPGGTPFVGDHRQCLFTGRD